ncbi:MAG: hypothetical protein ACTSPV_01235 [Candidatus Hodarchaeales archaeon]
MPTIYVTDKKIPICKAFIEKIDLMIDRIERKNPKLDAIFQNEGLMGLGKTTLSCLEGYYVHYRTGRPFSDKNVFLDIKEAINFAKNTEKQIIIYDEPAFAGLKADWRSKLQKDLITLIMTARKKRHFTIFNFVRFYKFNEFIAVDVQLGMAHLYERRDKPYPALAYIPRAFLESLYNDAVKKHQKNYFKYTLFTGEFGDVLNPDKKYNILDVFDMESYEKKKDKAISKIGEDRKEKDRQESKILKKKLGNIKKFPINSRDEFAELLGIHPQTFYKWAKITLSE